MAQLFRESISIVYPNLSMFIQIANILETSDIVWHRMTILLELQGWVLQSLPFPSAKKHRCLFTFLQVDRLRSRRLRCTSWCKIRMRWDSVDTQVQHRDGQGAGPSHAGRNWVTNEMTFAQKKASLDENRMTHFGDLMWFAQTDHKRKEA